jgi:hypothetical protein
MPSSSQGESGGELAVVLPAGRAAGSPTADRAPAADRALAAVRARPRWWVELFTIAWLAWVYDLVNNLAPLRYSVAIGHAQGVFHLEQTLHLDPEVTLNRWLTHHHTLAVVSSYYYDNAHFIVTLGLLGWLWWRGADSYRPMRTALVLMNVIGLAVFWLYPLAPPRMLDGFSDVVASTGVFGEWHSGTLAGAANQLAAMPSLHMAWATWCGVVIWRLSGKAWARALALFYPCVTCVAVLATGNHFLLDVLAGVATAALAFALVRPVTVAGSACHKLVTKSPIG